MWHTAEVLRQVDDAKVEKGGWVGGDAWFGSVMSCVEVMKRHEVHSTFIVKNNHQLFPMECLLAVLKARYGTKPAGKWVTFRAEIAGVKLIAMVYAWSQRGVSYFVSTCGRTDPHPVKYRSNYEDDFGVVTYKELERPWIAHFLYQYLPLIDEHNRQRQSLLHLERCWNTKDCWFRLLTTLCGMAIVDFQRFIKNKLFDHQFESDEDDVEDFENKNELQIRKFSDKICKWLDTVELRQRASPRKTRRSEMNEADMLIRITSEKFGGKHRDATRKQVANGKRKGNAVTRNCFVCRMYLNDNGKPTYHTTTWWCKDCGMPLCKKDRSNGNNPRRTSTCLEVHLNSEDEVLFCKGTRDDEDFIMPSRLSIPYPRRSERNNE